MTSSKPLVLTAGEPAGIGPELCNALADTPWRDEVVVVGDRRLLDERLEVIDTPCPAAVEPGRPDSGNAAALLEGLRIAAEGCQRDAIVRERKEEKKGAKGRPRHFAFAWQAPSKAFNVRIKFRKSRVSKAEVLEAVRVLLEQLEDD